MLGCSVAITVVSVETNHRAQARAEGYHPERPKEQSVRLEGVAQRERERPYESGCSSHASKHVGAKSWTREQPKNRTVQQAHDRANDQAEHRTAHDTK